VARLDVYLAATGNQFAIMATIAVRTSSGEPVTGLQPDAFSAVLVRGPDPSSGAAGVPSSVPPVGHHPPGIRVIPQGMDGFYNFIMPNPFSVDGTFDVEKQVHIQLRVTVGPDQGAAAYAVTILQV
jgi:hypothetical protein